jgi:hypothetical protein
MKGQKRSNLILNEITCPICGKTKPLPYGTDMTNYVYKAKINGKSRYLCSYHCFRVAEKRRERAKMTQKFSKDDRLGFALNYCIGGFEQAVADLPKGATEAEIMQAIRKTRIAIGTLMADVREIEYELENKKITKARREE